MAAERSVVGSRLINRNVNATSGRTSMRLEPEVWEALREICLREGCDLGELIQRIDSLHEPATTDEFLHQHILLLPDAEGPVP